jgi:ribosomal protein L37AE/L43A/transposase-like protein
MARNKVQLQKGLSMAAFNQRYGTEDQCHAALATWRWPDGFRCPQCGGAKHSFIATRRLFQCSACSLQTSAKAGTIFHASRTPLTKWFLAIHLMTSAKNDIAALELSRHLDVKWDTAWLIKQKLMEVMRQRNSTYKLDGLIQVDDAYVGGEKPGKSGRGAKNKLPFVVAVSTVEGKPVYTQLRVVPGFSKEAIRDWAKASIVQGSHVFSDGLGCFNGLDEAGLVHTKIITGGGRPKDPEFLWVNITLGNVKSAVTGTCRSLDEHHTPRYLAAYEWRYNRRFNLEKNLERLARVAVTTAPAPYGRLAAVRSKKYRHLAEASG